MVTREIVKIHNGWTIVSSHPDEACYRHATRKSAQRQLDAWALAEEEAKAWDAQCRAHRLAAVLSYLEIRSERKAQDARQMVFAF
jgi:hypothetical protein